MAISRTKSDLVDLMAEEADIPKARARRALEGFIGAVEDALQSGGKVTVTGFGTFSVSEHKARTGRNPQTGESMHIPARMVPKFKAGKGLKDAVADAPSTESGTGGSASQPSEPEPAWSFSRY